MTRLKGTLYEYIYAIVSLNSPQPKVVEKIKTSFMFSKFFGTIPCTLWDNVEKML